MLHKHLYKPIDDKYLKRIHTQGALLLESGTGKCCGHDPLFSGQSAVLPSLSFYHECAAHGSSQSILSFEKNFEFLASVLA